MRKTLAIGNRGQNAFASPIRKLVPYALAAKEKGTKIYHINIGDPDFSLPEKIKQTLEKVAKDTNRIPYPAFRGEKDLLDGWITYYQQIKLPVTLTHEDMVATAGASDAMVLTAATLLDPDDEVIVFEPFYAPYRTYAQFISAKVVAVTLDPKTGYHLPEKEKIIAKITPKTKAIFFINPNNPTGTVFNKTEIQTLIDIAYEHNLFLVSDETYRGMVFDNKESLSTLHIAQEKHLNHIVVTDSLSKRLNVCGARTGVVVSKNKDVIAAVFKFVQGRPFAAFLEQKIVAPMLKDSLPYVEWLSKEYQKRRDAFITTLEQELNIKIHRPEGAFYTMVQLPIADTEAFAKWLLTDFVDNGETVMVTPGAGFYMTEGKGKNEIRVAYVLNEADLKKAAILLAKAVRKYNQK